MSGNILSRAVHVIDLDDSRFHSGMRAVEQNARQGATRVQGLLRSALAIGVGSSAFTSVIFGLRRGFEAAAEGVIVFNARLDQTTATFTKLLGSQAEAQAKFAELFEFAKRTPFNFDAVLKGATALQVFGAATNDAAGAVAGVGQSVLLSKENLKLFGDAAAATVDVTGSLENGFKQSTFWIGRMYQALQNNAPIGRAAMSLERLGLLLPEIRTQIELAASAGASGDEQFDIFKRSLERFRGLQEEQQDSFFTQISTVQDNITRILAKVGRPVYEDIIGFLKRANDTLESGNATSFVDDLTAGVERMARAGKSFLSDPRMQQDAKTFLHDAAGTMKAIVSFTATLVETAKPFVGVLSLIVRGVDAIAKGFGANVLTLGALIGLAVKFRRALTIGADIATGKQLSTNLVRDNKSGNILTNKERTEFERQREQELRDEIATLRIREQAKINIANRSQTSLGAVQNQVTRNIDNRAERAAKSAQTAYNNQLSVAKGLVAAKQSEIAAADKLAATQAQVVKLTAEQQAVERALLDQKKLIAAADADITANEQQQAVITNQLYDATKRLTLEKQAEARIAAQERAIAATALDLRTVKAGSEDETKLRDQLTKQKDELVRLQQQSSKVGGPALLDEQTKLKQLQADRTKLAREELDLQKQHASISNKIAQLSSVETAQTLKRIDASENVFEQQRKLTNGLQGQRLLQSRATQLASAGATVQEDARLANAASTSADKIAAARRATEARVAAEKELQKVLGGSNTLSDKFNTVLGRVTQGLFVLALAYEGVNIATGILFHDSLPGLIQSLTKYGDTLGHARKEAQLFAEAQRDNIDGGDQFAKEIEKQKIALQALLAEQEKRKQNDIQKTIDQGELNPFDPRAIRNSIESLRGIGTDRSIDETRAKIAELQRQLDEYNKHWSAVNDNAKAYSSYLDGNLQLTRAEVIELEKLRKTDPGFDAAVQKLQDEAAAKRKALGTSSLDPAILKQIGESAAQFRDVGQKALKNFLAGFDTAQLSDFSELSDLATKIFESTGKEGAVQEIAFGNLQVAIARAVDETTRLHGISSQTKADIRGLVGDQADEVIHLAEALGELRTSLEVAALAAKRYKEAQDATAIAETALNAVIASHAKSYDEMAAGMKRAADQRQEDITAARDYADGLKNAAEEQARSDRKHIETLQEEQRATQEAADAFDRAASKREQAAQDAIDAEQRVVDGLQQQLDDLNRVATNNANVFQAIIDGRLEDYVRERGELSETEKAIIQRYGAELEGIRKVRDATRQRTDTMSRAQREQLLAFSEAINTARQQGNRAEVARLTRERSRYQQRSQRPIDLENERATVAQDRLDAATAPIENAAKEQAIRDKQAITLQQQQVDAATAQLAAMQDQAERDKRANDETRAAYAEQIRIMGDGISQAERDAKTLADKSDEEVRAAENAVKTLEANDKRQKERDDQRLANLKAINDTVEASYKDEVGKLQAIEDYNKRLADQADADAKKQQDIVDRLKLQNGLMDTQVGYLDKILKALTGGNVNVPTPNPAGPEEGTAENPVPGSNNPRDISGPHAIPNNTKRLGQAPSGYHDEIVGGNYYWIPDGYEYDPSSTGNVKAKAPTSTAPAPAPTPTPAPSGGGGEQNPTVGPTAGLRIGGDLLTAGLRAGLGGGFGSAGIAVPSKAALAYTPTIDATAGGLTVNGPLIGAATIREDADAALIGNAIVAGMVDAFDRNGKRGLIRPLGARG